MAKIKGTPKKATSETPSENAVTEISSADKFASMQAQIAYLTELVKKTGDMNKIADFDREKNKKQGFAFSIKLIPTDSGDKVITSWKMIKDNVFEYGKIVDQQIEITYEDGEETKKKTMPLTDFARNLKRSPKIVAKRIENLDGSLVYQQKVVNDETGLETWLLKPEENTFSVVLEIEWKEYSILSTYLNA